MSRTILKEQEDEKNRKQRKHVGKIRTHSGDTAMVARRWQNSLWIALVSGQGIN
jgi:hypothetical protein